MRVAFIFAVLSVVMFANAASVSAARRNDEIAGAKVGTRTSPRIRIRGLKKKPEKNNDDDEEEETLRKMCYYSEVVKTFVERATLPLFFAQVLNLYLTECEAAAEETPTRRRRLETREVAEGAKKAESEMKKMLCSYSDVFRSFLDDATLPLWASAMGEELLKKCDEKKKSKKGSKKLGDE